jgi:hypothetical protein
MRPVEVTRKQFRRLVRNAQKAGNTRNKTLEELAAELRRKQGKR